MVSEIDFLIEFHNLVAMVHNEASGLSAQQQQLSVDYAWLEATARDQTVWTKRHFCPCQRIQVQHMQVW